MIVEDTSQQDNEMGNKDALDEEELEDNKQDHNSHAEEECLGFLKSEIAKENETISRL